MTIGALVIAALAAGGAGLPWPLLFTQAPVEASTEGARVVRLEPDGGLKALTEAFAWAGDPDVSPDGTRFLFSGRRAPGEPRAIWEMSVGGGEPRRLTEIADGDCAEPIYMSRNALDPPDFEVRVRWFAYTSDQAATVDLRLGGRARHLYARTLDPVPGQGIVTWRTTYGPASARAPAMLRDGRVIFSTWLHEGAGAGRYHLLAMNWAGTGINPVYGAHEGPAFKGMAAEMPDRTVVFVESEEDGAGRLAEIAWRRPLHSHRALSRDAARYRDPAALPDGRLIVARAEGAASFGLALFDRETGQPGSTVWDDPARHDVDPQPVAPRFEPMARIAEVWPGQFDTGDLTAIDVYESDRPELQGIPRGTIRAIRVIEALPRENRPGVALPPFDAGAPFGATADLRTRILGEIPVMPDGSFHVRLPANVPFTLQTLDAEGAAVRTMRTWMWLRPWNRRGCVGCHEDKELAPPNRTTLAMRSLLRPELGEATARRTPDFVHDVTPILRARCTGGCHGPPPAQEAPTRPTLVDWSEPPYNRAYRRLVPAHVVPGRARESALWRRLNDGHAPLLDAERRTLAAWIDLGAQWDATDYDIPVLRAAGEPAVDGGARAAR